MVQRSTLVPPTWTFQLFVEEVVEASFDKEAHHVSQTLPDHSLAFCLAGCTLIDYVWQCVFVKRPSVF